MSHGNLAAAGGVLHSSPGRGSLRLLLPARLSGAARRPPGGVLGRGEAGCAPRPTQLPAFPPVQRGDLAGFVSLRRCDFRANPACSVFPNPHLEGRSHIRIRVLPTHPVPCHLPSSPASPGPGWQWEVLSLLIAAFITPVALLNGLTLCSLQTLLAFASLTAGWSLSCCQLLQLCRLPCGLQFSCLCLR